MRLPLAYIAVALVLAMTPGSKELVENAVHLFGSGHLAHAVDDGEHEPADAEHHCAGVLHSCSCHHVSVVTPELAPRTDATDVHTSDRIAEPVERLADGFGDSLFRPPIA